MTPARQRNRHRQQQQQVTEPSAPGFSLPPWVPAVAVWIAVAAAVFVLTFRTVTDPDTWFHLELGEWIAANNALPHTDPFSYTAGDTPYVPSGWATAWLMFQLDKIYPESSLGYILMVTVVIALTAMVVLWRGRRTGTTVTTGLLLMAGLTAAVVRFSPRPDVFSILGLTSALALMSSHWTSRTGDRKEVTQWPATWRHWLLVPLVIAWANLHAGVLVAIPFMGVYALWLLVQWWNGRDKIWLHLAAPVVIACFAWLLNPYGWGLVGLAQRIAQMPEASWVMEWMPFFKQGFPLAWPVYVCTGIIVAALVWALIQNRRAFHPVEIIWIVMLIALALMQRRQISLFALGVPLLLARHMVPVEAWLRGRTRIIATAAPLATAAVVVVLQISGANGTGGGRPFYGRSSTELPVFTADYLADVKVPQPIFNSYNMGGYLLHKLYPDTKVYIDGRLDVYPEQVWLDMLAVEENRLRIDDLVARYGIQTFVVGVSDSWGDPMHLASRLAQRDDYVLAHFDDVAAVFVRNSLENLAWIERYGYRTVNPWNLQEMAAAASDAGEAEGVIREMGRMLQQSPASAATHALAAYIAWTAGDPVTMNEQLASARRLQRNNRLLQQVQRQMAAGPAGRR